jgi:hypothetical protein
MTATRTFVQERDWPLRSTHRARLKPKEKLTELATCSTRWNSDVPTNKSRRPTSSVPRTPQSNRKSCSRSLETAEEKRAVQASTPTGAKAKQLFRCGGLSCPGPMHSAKRRLESKTTGFRGSLVISFNSCLLGVGCVFVYGWPATRQRDEEKADAYNERCAWIAPSSRSAFVSSFHDFTQPQGREFHEIQPDFMKFMKRRSIS